MVRTIRTEGHHLYHGTYTWIHDRYRQAFNLEGGDIKVITWLGIIGGVLLLLVMLYALMKRSGDYNRACEAQERQRMIQNMKDNGKSD